MAALGSLSPWRWGWLVLEVVCPGSPLSFQPSPVTSAGMRMVGVAQVWQAMFSMGKISSPFARAQIAFALKELHHGVCTHLRVSLQ